MFGRKKKEEAKKKGTMDKLVMGAIIGTAIGSVIGMTVAPKKGEATRQYIKDKYKNRDELIPKEEINEIKKLTKETVVGVGSLVKNFIFGRKKKVSPAADENREHHSMKKIPLESEKENTFDHLQE
jgi:gas vesicle protein